MSLVTVLMREKNISSFVPVWKVLVDFGLEAEKKNEILTLRFAVKLVCYYANGEYLLSM